MTNLLKALHIGQVVYSPMFGDAEVVTLDADEVYCITVRTAYYKDFYFDKYGRYAIGGVPLLFIKEK